MIEARELKGVDSGGTSDPICVVTVMGRKQETEKYHKVARTAARRERGQVTTVIMDKLLFFEFDNLTEEEIQRGTINIEMYSLHFAAG